MLRNIIEGAHTTEIYEIGSALKRGSVVTKNYTTKVADKASDEGVQIYLVDSDFVPTGYESDLEISEYTDQADIVAANTLAVLIKPSLGSQWATDQVVATGLAAGDYLIAGTVADVGLLIKAVATKVSTYRYVGTYDDAGNTLYQFEVVAPHTV